MEPNPYRFTVRADHPCLAGHFPGHPIVPAVVLLDRVFCAAREQLGEPARLRAVSNAKFLQPVLPDQEVTVLFDRGNDSTTIAFRCLTSNGIVAQGRFLVGSRP